MGEYLIQNLRNIFNGNHIIKEVRGKGLFIGIEFVQGNYADKFSKKLVRHGLIAKTTHKHIIRFSPPLIITKPQVD